jgi:hypothetical protein
MQRSVPSVWQWRVVLGCVALALLGVPAWAAASPVLGATGVDGPAAVQQEQDDPFVFTDDRVLVYFTVKGTHTAEFELVMNKVHDVLRSSDKAERRRQAQGWKVEKVGTPLADGTFQYIFVLDPVEKGVSYNPFTILDEELPREEVVDLHLRVNEGIVKIATVPIHSLVWMGGATR